MSPDMLAKPMSSSTEMFPIKRDRSLASEVIGRSGTDLNICFRCGT